MNWHIIEQRDHLLSLLKNTPDLRQLAANPLMLTLIVLLHTSGRSFPYRRIELYHIVAHTLLSTWNQESGRATLSAEEAALAELLLGEMAYRLQCGPPVLSAHELHLLTREAMEAFDPQRASTIKEHDILQFIETLRRSSGLLVEIGEKLFCLASPAFQSYFVARYLLRKPRDERRQFVLDHCSQASWREPLLLMIADICADDSVEGQQTVGELLQVILDATRRNDAQSNVIFVLTCLTVCVPWWMNRQLHQQTVKRLFTVYGDALEAGHSILLSRELKASMGTWLSSQAQEKDEQGIVLPLWQEWRRALCDDTHPACQEGAVWLLAELVADFPAPSVLDMLCAPLLQLAGTSVLPPVVERQVSLPNPAARAATPEVTQYAQKALQGSRSLPGRIYESWLLKKQGRAAQSGPPPRQPPIPPDRQKRTGTNAESA